MTFLFPNVSGGVAGAGLYANFETALIIAAFTVPPDAARAALIDTLVGALKTGGAWATFDCYYMLAAHDAQAARVNWKTPGTFSLTAVNSPTFTTDRGYAGNGTTSYLSTGFNPMVGTLQWAVNSAHLAVWSRTSAQDPGIEVGARISSTDDQAILLCRNASDLAIVRFNQDSVTGASGSSTDGSGHFLGRRSASNAQAVFRNATSLGTSSVTTTTMPNFAFYIGAINQNGTAAVFSARQLAMASIGSNQSDAIIVAREAAERTFLVALGAA